MSEHELAQREIHYDGKSAGRRVSLYRSVAGGSIRRDRFRAESAGWAGSFGCRGGRGETTVFSSRAIEAEMTAYIRDVQGTTRPAAGKVPSV